MTSNLNKGLKMENIKSEIEDEEIDNASYDIRTYGADYTLEIYSKKIEEKEICIPKFQRRYVWNSKKASKLIESFLLGLPVPQVFLYRQQEDQNLLVIDGQQRLKSINYFFNGSFENGKNFYLQSVKSQWEGKTYKDLTDVEQKKLKNTILRATIFEQIKPEDSGSSMFQIFERLNSGGVSLSQQEIRRSIYYGSIVNFLEEINKTHKWREILHKDEPDLRMRDVEMILRFFSLSEHWKDYDDSMKDFINGYMSINRNLNKNKELELTKKFNSVIEKIYNDIGKQKAFRIKNGINVAVFDSVMVAIAVLDTKVKNNIKESYEKLVSNEAYLAHVSQATTNKTAVLGRIKMAIEAFKK